MSEDLLPRCLAVYVAHIIAILGIDSRAVPAEGGGPVGGEGEVQEPAADLAPPRQMGPSVLWEDMVQEFHQTGVRCLVLSKRTAARMGDAPEGDALLPIDAKCVKMLLDCPTLSVAAPLWAHVNVCRTCSSLVLQHLQSAWHKRPDGSSAEPLLEGSGADSGGGPSCVSEASRELTVLGQMAVSRALVMAVWER